MIQFLTHTGSGPNQASQECAHQHNIQVVQTPASQYAFICDLGLDAVVQYKIETATGRLVLNDICGYFDTGSGSGPRHMAFDHNKNLAYIVNELESTVVVATLNQYQGTLTEVQRITTLPAGFSGQSTCAAIRLSPNGKYLFVSNRGNDSIAMFAVDKDGRLSSCGHHPCGGRTPRDFNIDPSGRIMIIAHQDSDTIRVCSINEAHDKIALKDECLVSARTPVQIQFRKHQ
jgi:6-phosphogluconolactonase